MPTRHAPLLEQFRAAAQRAGVKLTHQRLEIFLEVASSQDHPDAETVFRAVRERVPTISLDTVYRALWMLNDLGLITTLGRRRGSARFDGNIKEHHHYICVRCGLARDFESPEFNSLAVPETVHEFGRVIATHVEVQGLCRKCASHESSDAGRGKTGRPQRRERKLQ